MRILPEYKRGLEVIEQYIRLQAREDEVLQVLEAGCGREWYFRMNDTKYELTGIDLDSAALQARKARKGDLTHCIVGDLRTADLQPGKYDVIYNAFVLEHVTNAQRVLENFDRWLKPGGIMILRFPDRDSVHGLITRLTPFWVHVLYYRYVWGLGEAGKPGFAPYPTVYEHVVSSRGIREFSAKHHLIIREEFGCGTFRRGRGIFKTLTLVFANLISLLSLGRIHSKYIDLTYVLEKPA